MKLIDDDEAKSVSPTSVVQVCLGHHVRKAARSFTRAYDNALQPCGLNFSQFNILVVVAALEPVQAPKIATYMAMDRTTLSRNLKPLKRSGYLESGGGAGRRPDIVELTYAGHTILAEGYALWRVAQSDLAEGLGPGRAGQLLEILGDWRVER